MRELFALVGKLGIEGVGLVEKQLATIDKDARKLERSIDRMGKRVAAVGKSMSRAFTVPLVAMGAAAYKGVQAASDLAETTAKVGEIFEGSAGEIEAWSKTTATGMGQSRTQAMDAAASFAIFGKSAGMAGGDLVKFSTDFTKLASDLASFNNTTPEEAIVAIGAAMRGESEPIRRYGVLLNDATLKARAMKLGIIETTKDALTPQQKVLAASAEIMAQTTTAQGDFARTQDGLANQTRIFKAEVADLTAKFGQAFLPIALQVTATLRDRLLPTVQRLVEWFGGLSSGARKNIVVFGAMLAAAGPLVLVIGKLISAFKILGPAIALVKSATLKLNAAMLANPYIAAAVAVGVFAAAIYGAVKAYQTLRAEHDAFTVQTVEQAGVKKFTAGVDALTKKIRDNAAALSDEAAAQALLGADFDALAEQARELGYVVEGDLQEKLARLVEISHAVRGGVFEMGRGLATAAKGAQAVAAATVEQTKLTEEQIAALKKEAAEVVKLAQTREEFEADWTRKLAEQVGTRLQILDMEEREAIAQAEAIEADTFAIRLVYAARREELAEEERKKAAEKAKAVADAATEYQRGYTLALLGMTGTRLQILEQEKQDALQKADELGAERLAILQYYAELERQIRRESFDDWLSTAQSVIGQIAELGRMSTENHLAEIDQRVEREKAAIDASVLSEEEKAAKKKAIDEQADKERRKLAREQAKRDKAAAIFGAIINTAQAVSKALTLGFPLGIVMAVLMGVLGAAQVALIASKPLPALAEGGLIRGGRGGTTALVGEGHDDELVLPMRTGAEALAEALTRRLSEISLPEPRQGGETARAETVPAVAFATAGGPAGGRAVHLHIGTLIADNFGLKMLERRLRDIRIGEDQRRGN